ncbi:hypothetical protein BDV23DRAFT_156625 [Aspergillus alliaceus]|uniref:Uncharacterized protein n=1 Tax=Petromyces alliaceus TaxID=209559 RepID=A0A5N6FKR0_PETAA|nr:uncharacterized protein BDW43DRAFT_285614 [Aspergillus alliaceus]KAB8230521.1 hypothetical protein BDW43DRAFT_285614 [Aspergillus alliaceus]KAE8389853.1 hypothetical protein BDV23DRAFT_156625 [Aspergillus alliaceus]
MLQPPSGLTLLWCLCGARRMFITLVAKGWRMGSIPRCPLPLFLAPFLVVLRSPHRRCVFGELLFPFSSLSLIRNGC